MAQQRRRKAGQRKRSPSPPARRPVIEATTLPGPPETPPPPPPQTFEERYRARSEARNAEARAGLEPLAPGERPWPIVVGAVLTLLSGVSNLALYLAGVKIRGGHTNGPEIIVFSGLMIACAVGMWRLWYQAVLAFMALLAIIIVLFSLFLIEASNALGFVVAPLIIVLAGTLFWKLVRVLGRLQMPARPGAGH